MSCITLRCIIGNVFVQIPWKTTQNKSKMIAMQLLKVSKIRVKTAVFKKLLVVICHVLHSMYITGKFFKTRAKF